MIRIAFSLVVMAGLTGSLCAHGQHGVEVEVANGKLVSSAIADSKVFHGVDVFLASLGNRFGIEAQPGTFASGTQLKFKVLDAIKVQAQGNFDTTSPVALKIAHKGQSIVAQNGPMDGFPIATEADGGLHLHFDFSLPNGSLKGLLLVKIQLESANGSLGPTEPIYIVLNAGMRNIDAESAVTYVEDTIVQKMHFNDAELKAGAPSFLEIHIATPGENVVFLGSAQIGAFQAPACGATLALSNPLVLAGVTAVGDEALLPFHVPSSLLGQTFHFQAIEPETCRVSNHVSVTVD